MLNLPFTHVLIAVFIAYAFGIFVGVLIAEPLRRVLQRRRDK